MYATYLKEERDGHVLRIMCRKSLGAIFSRNVISRKKEISEVPKSRKGNRQLFNTAKSDKTKWVHYVGNDIM